MSLRSEEEIQALIEKSSAAKEQSYSPYSKFRVGAALLCTDGTVITGCNVENVTYGLTICAERTAICSAVARGLKKFTAIAISSDMKDKFIVPCGMCRQSLIEFAAEMDVYVTKSDGSYKPKKLTELLPDAFTPNDLL